MRLKHVKNADKVVESGVYYVNDPKQHKGSWKNIFKNNNPIYIEIGMGKGDFIIENALKYPNINFIGIEMYDSVMIRAVQKSNELELNNLKLVKIDATYIEEIFNKEIDLIYLNFSDPWPKDRHAKRRLTSSRFLERYDKIFRDNPKIIMKTDNVDLFNFSVTIRVVLAPLDLTSFILLSVFSLIYSSVTTLITGVFSFISEIVPCLSSPAAYASL